MNWSHETWLMWLVLGLVLQDSLFALAPDEALLVASWRGRWRARFGARLWTLGGREIALANPFTPQRALFRLRWRIDAGGVAAGPPRTLVLAPELRRFAPFVWVAWTALFVLLPLGLFTRLGVPLVLAAVALLYLNNGLAFVLAWRWRKRLGVDAAGLGKLALECLACAPYGVNLVRRLCALMAVQEDFLQAATRLLAPDTLQQVHVQCLLRLDDRIEAEPEGSARIESLRAARARFL